MLAHFHRFRNEGKYSPGVLLVPQSLDVGTAIEELLLIWLASGASEWDNRLEWLPL
jgi:hypothetical protein